MNEVVWKSGSRRLLVVSNRLPIAISDKEGRKEIKSGSGGLVTALAPIVRKNKGVWIGWPGCEVTSEVQQLLSNYSKEKSFNLEAVKITPEEEKKYYRGFSNEAIWPLFHDLLGHCKFELENWLVYSEVNRRFAKKIAEVAREDDFIWIHDYHLLRVAHYLRQLRVSQPLAFFLHIPFPNYELLRRLPWKYEIIMGLLQYDLVGFQTERDRKNFCRSAKELFSNLEIKYKTRYSDITYDSHSVKVGHFPISIDFDEFSGHAEKPEVIDEARKLREKCNATKLMLGVDRLDYTKGIPLRFYALEKALEKYPELQGNLSLLQLVVPSRSHLSAYQNLKEDLDKMVGRINGKFSKFGWQAIQYMYRSVSRTELIGSYRACEIGLLTPLRDGMNLVSKEYCASSNDNNGVLILSEFAGASEQLSKGAIVVNPYNIEETARAIYDAYHMTDDERTRRMKLLRGEVRRNDIYKWVDWFLSVFQKSDSKDGKKSVTSQSSEDFEKIPEKEQSRVNTLTKIKNNKTLIK